MPTPHCGGLEGREADGAGGWAHSTEVPVPLHARLPCCTQPVPSTNDNPGQTDGSAATEGAAEVGLGCGAEVHPGVQAQVGP